MSISEVGNRFPTSDTGIPRWVCRHTEVGLPMFPTGLRAHRDRFAHGPRWCCPCSRRDCGHTEVGLPTYQGGFAHLSGGNAGIPMWICRFSRRERPTSEVGYGRAQWDGALSSPILRRVFLLPLDAGEKAPDISAMRTFLLSLGWMLLAAASVLAKPYDAESRPTTRCSPPWCRARRPSPWAT